MSVTIRAATPEDAERLVDVVDLASEGLLPMLWSGMAPEGVAPREVGLGLVLSDSGEFSFRHAWVAELGGEVVGGLIGYPLPEEPAPPDPEIPAMFAGVQELADLAPGRWYINFVAIFPAARGRGAGRALLDQAERSARAGGCPGLALIVAATNTNAIGIYERAGYREVARRPFDISDFGYDPTEALLMMKDLA